MRDIAALVRFLQERASIPFAWQKGRDCVSFAAAAVEAQTGSDPLAGLQWRSKDEAKAVLDRLGGLEKAMDARFHRIPPAMAARGDVAGIPDAEFGVTLMVVEGRFLVGPGGRGAKRLPRARATAAWSIHPPIGQDHV